MVGRPISCDVCVDVDVGVRINPRGQATLTRSHHLKKARCSAPTACFHHHHITIMAASSASSPSRGYHLLGPKPRARLTPKATTHETRLLRCVVGRAGVMNERTSKGFDVSIQ